MQSKQVPPLGASASPTPVCTCKAGDGQPRARMTWLGHGQVGDKSAVREFFIGIIFVGINGINNKLGFFYMRVICVVCTPIVRDNWRNPTRH